MLTRKKLFNLIHNFLTELKALGYQPEKVILFGSYAKGNPHENSDVDLAIWNEGFSGVNFIDFEPFVHIVSKYHPLQLHTFASGETELDNPFIQEITSKGILIDLP
ncbi:MAG: nucleotidyltransferase family protein [Cytophagales bacterium]